MTPGSRTLLARMESAGPGVARALEIGVGERSCTGSGCGWPTRCPMCVEDAYLAASMVPGLLENLPLSLYDELERRHLAPTWGEDSVDAGLAAEPEAQLLGVTIGNPVLRVARRAFCDRCPSRCRGRPTGPTGSRCGSR